ncbi:ataxin-10 isoform X2 [Trichomycterus rosablanca]|uniref:ataxin-10 isoform X2 n=1 Tax=Trichomycterus rosablanca TaxID=2290929 RepID=UPI002F35CD16
MMDEIGAENFKPDHLSVLKAVSSGFKDEQFRCSVDATVLQNLSAVLSRLFHKLQVLSEDDQGGTSTALCLQLTAECLRALRNACVLCPRNQCILRDQGCIQLTLGILGELLKWKPASSDHFFDALRCGIQFLGNIAVGNRLCKDYIWAHGFPHRFPILLELSDVKAVAYTSMVLHTCLDEDKTENLGTDQCKLKVALKIIELCRTLPDIEWTFQGCAFFKMYKMMFCRMLIVTQHFFKSSGLFEKMYEALNNQERITLLELVSAHLGEREDEEDVIPLRTAQFLASCFQQSCKAVLTLSSVSSSDEQALAVIRLLDILCDMTSDQRKFMPLQDHPDLLQTTINLLKEVHLLGKASRNVFSAAQDFSFKAQGEEGTHPALSFKAHLIRLIGNLCHGHSANQDQVRELDGIALILDNCSIDSNNPSSGLFLLSGTFSNTMWRTRSWYRA